MYNAKSCKNLKFYWNHLKIKYKNYNTPFNEHLSNYNSFGMVEVIMKKVVAKSQPA